MAKSWLPKKELTIPLLELLAGQMATYLAQNIKEVLEGFRVRTVYGWLDTSVTLHWIHGNRKCKQLVRNWVRNIQVKQINCRHVPTEENPRDSQMCGVGEEMLTDWELFGGRDQAGYHNHRTGHQTLQQNPLKESKAEEVKQMSKLFAIVAEKTEKSDTFSELLNKHKQWHVLQVGARIVRFLHNMTTAQKQSCCTPYNWRHKEIDYILDQVSPTSSTFKWETFYSLICKEIKREYKRNQDISLSFCLTPCPSLAS